MNISSYKISISIFILYFITSSIFYFILHNWSALQLIISIFMPLIILFFKLEYDENKKREENRLVSRNFLLSYQAELNLVIRDFSKHRLSYIDKDLEALFNVNNSYEEIINNKDEVQEVFRIARNNSKNLSKRLEVHENLSRTIIKMLRHNELVFTDEAYSLIETLNYFYVWHYEEYYSNLREGYSNLFLIYAVNIDVPANKQNVINNWSDLCGYVKGTLNKVNLDLSVSHNLVELLNLLNKEKKTLER